MIKAALIKKSFSGMAWSFRGLAHDHHGWTLRYTGRHCVVEELRALHLAGHRKWSVSLGTA